MPQNNNKTPETAVHNNNSQREVILIQIMMFL